MSNSKRDPDIGTTDLLGRLAAARRRLDVQRGLIGAAWSALAAAVVVVLLQLASLAGLIGSLGGSEWQWAGVVFVPGLLVTAVSVWRSRPDLLQMARRADRRFDLKERLSTTVELDSRGGDVDRASPVVAALFRDAAAHASRVDPRRLVPFEIPRPAVAFVVVTAGVILLQLISPAVGSDREPGAALLAAAADPDAEASSELILDIADLMREQAEEESNNYLRVVATSLEQLASDVVEQGRGGQPVADELARLLSQAEGAATSVSESGAESEGFSLTLADVEEFLATEGERELVARADGVARDAPMAEAETAPVNPSSLFAAVMARARQAVQSVRSESTGEPTDPEALADALADAMANPDSMSDMGSMDEAMEGTPSPGAPPPDVTVGGRPLANIDLGGGTVVDEQSPGNVNLGIGMGAAAVTAERVGVPDVASSRDFELPTEGGSRRRLPEEIVPQTRFTEVAESPLPRGAWSQTTQEQVSSGYLGVSYRDVASRYFLARIQQAKVQAEPASP
jgi:hypothetical protein